MLIESSVDRNLYEVLDDQGLHPPGRDPSLGSFYRAVVQMINEGDNLAFILGEAQRHRLEITAEHMANLLFRSVQRIELGMGDTSYRFFEEPAQWRRELSKLTSDKQHRDALIYSLNHRTTSTTIYQRYAGPYAIIVHLFDGSPVSVVDLGCGGNFGLRGFELHEPLVPPNDNTPNQTVT
ncbi:MAG: hypothetical protein Q8Q65_02835, partial [bacterium]|nr:hypothetical protein [bacterium]